MKKYAYLLTSCFALCHSAQAFDMFQDDEGFQAVQFKKTGDEFNPDIEAFIQHPASRNIQQIYFENGIPYDNQAKVYDEICNRLNLVHIANADTEGFLENAETNYAIVDHLKQLKTKKGMVFTHMDSLDLKYFTKQELNYLPFFKKIVGGMDKVRTLHFDLPTFTPETIKPLAIMLMQNEGIDYVMFHGKTTNIKNILTELLFIPQKMTYCFDINSLAHLSVDFLENELKERQTHQSKKVITLVDNYVGDYYNYAWKDYKAICLNPIYSKIFKASYVDSVNEREQKKHLRKMINQPLHEQIQEMQIVLKKEESGYKALSIYKTTFQQINEILKQQSALTKQENTEEYSKLETNKINIINKIIEKLS